MTINNKKKIIIVGAGYAGITLIEKLKNNKNLDITLINRSKYHLHQTDLHKYISGNIEFSKVAFNLYDYAAKKNINFLVSNVEDIFFKEKKVLLDNDDKIEYDYLVIATGNKSIFPKQIKNIEEYAQDIKDVKILKEKREEFLNLINEKRANKNIAIVGAGLSGVEVALEFAQALKERNIKEDECKISLVEQYKDVLPNMDPFLVDQTREICDKLGIKRYHGEFVTEVKNNTLFLGNKEEIKFDMIIFLIGVTGEKLVSDSDIETNIKNQFIVDDYLNLKGHEDVFVIGDIAQTIDVNGNYELPTAQIAKLQASLVAKNIKNDMKNKELQVNTLKTKGVMIDISKNKAVGVVSNVKVKGSVAYMLKRVVSKMHTKVFN